MPGADDLCTWDPHYEGAIVFGSQKRKPNTPIRVDKETHRCGNPNKQNRGLEY